MNRAQMSSEYTVHAHSDVQESQEKLFGAVNGNVIANYQARKVSSFSYNQMAA